MAIQMDRAIKLANRTPQWVKDNCKHLFEKEYHCGASTGDNVCVFMR